jgi:hypothetical protein
LRWSDDAEDEPEGLYGLVADTGLFELHFLGREAEFVVAWTRAYQEKVDRQKRIERSDEPTMRKR